MQRKLDDWLNAYITYTQNTECPQGFNFWVGAWTIAGALRRKVWIDMGHFQWYPNFYLFLVAPPGVVSKSTTLSIGTKLLAEVEGIKFGPEAMTWQALTQAMANAREEVLMSGEGIASEFMPMSCLNIAAGELGTLISPHNREMIDALTSLWDGKSGAWEKWTKTSGSDLIINPWLNIASCTTPAWIAQNFPEDLVGAGFTSRCIFVYADKKQKLIAYPRLQQPKNQTSLQQALIHDLEIISQIKGEYTLADSAVEFGTAWYAGHYQNPPPGIDPERFGGYLARKQTHMHKTAMVIAASYKNTLEITAEDLKKALILVESVEPHMQKVFESIGIEGSGKHLHIIMQHLEVRGKAARNELFALVSRRMSADEFDAAIVAGVRANFFRIEGEGAAGKVVLVKKPRSFDD